MSPIGEIGLGSADRFTSLSGKPAYAPALVKVKDRIITMVMRVNR